MKINKPSLIELAKVFLTIGTIGFGGGMAVMSLIQDYCVEKRRWLSNDEFSHGVALGQILGPFAVNTAIFVGYMARGFWGAVVAFFAFLVPSVTFVIILAGLYLHYQKIPMLQNALSGIAPVVIALILAAAFQIGKSKIKGIESVFLFVFTIYLTIFLKVQVYWILLIAILYGIVKTILQNIFIGDVNEHS